MGLLEDFSLSGKVALVTGGGTGIGRAVALGLAQAGADVALSGRTEQTLEESAADITALGREVLTVTCDVRDSGEVAAMVDWVTGHFGRMDVAFNNAGAFGWIPGYELSETDWDRIVDTNLKGVFLCMQAEARWMREHGGGKIINNASMSGSIVNHPQKQSTYNASKAGCVHLTKSLAAEWIGDGIYCNCISPGYIYTDRAAQNPAADPLRDHWNKVTPIGRPGVVEELAGAVLFLATPASDFVVGLDLIIDGGYSLW